MAFIREERTSMDSERCPVCDGALCGSTCTGFPGAVYAPHGQGWHSYNEAVLLEKQGRDVYWGDVWSYHRWGLTPEEGRVVVVDTETTGLDHRINEVVELAWHDMQYPQADVQSVRIDHTLANFSDEALRINRYRERNLGDPATWAPAHHRIETVVSAVMENAIVAGSNVAFDKNFIEARFGEQSWRHFPLEIGSYVAGFHRRTVPYRLSEIPEALNLLTQPNHTAVGDVKVVMSALHAVWSEES